MTLRNANGAVEQLAATHLLIAAGRVPNVENLGFEADHRPGRRRATPRRCRGIVGRSRAENARAGNDLTRGYSERAAITLPRTSPKPTR